MDFLQRFSLRRQMWLLISGAMVLTLVALLVCFALFSDGMLIEQTVATSMQKLAIVAQKLDMFTTQIEDAAVFVLTNDDVQQWLVNTGREPPAQPPSPLPVASYLYTMARMEHISNIVVYPIKTLDRYALFNYVDAAEAGAVRTFLDGEPKSAWRMNTGVYTIIGLLSAEKNPYMLMHYRKVYDKWTVRPLGAVAVMTAEAHVAGLYEDVPLGESGWYAIVDADGRIVSAADKSRLGEDASALLAEARMGTGARVPVDGVSSLLLALPYEKLGWTLLGVVPVAEITGPNRMLLVFALAIGLLCVLLALLISSAIASRMSRPILELKRRVIQAGAGERDLPLLIERSDEIGELNRAFARMLMETDELNRRIIGEHNKQKEAELSLLLSQLSPHFLYNSLECICGLSALGKNDEVIDATSELARFYRSVFSGKGKLTTVEGELDMARRYFNIMRYRYPGKLDFEIDCDPGVAGCLIVKLSLQPVIENAIIHGLRNSRRPWRIEIQAYREGDAVCVGVWDNGVGMDQQTIDMVFLSDHPADSRAHFGLRATNERIRLICGAGYGLKVYSGVDEGTMIVANFPAALREEAAGV